MCAAQTAHAAELDALRKANHRLSRQVRQLESSLAQINLEHCELVKQVVASRLEREELEDELVKCEFGSVFRFMRMISQGGGGGGFLLSPGQIRLADDLFLNWTANPAPTDKLAYADLSHVAAASQASASPVTSRRQSEMSIASASDDSRSSTGTGAGGTVPALSAGLTAGLGSFGGRWFGGSGRGSVSSSTMSRGGSQGP